MITSPFTLLRPFEDLIEIHLLTKEDAVKDDEGLREALGHNRIANL